LVWNWIGAILCWLIAFFFLIMGVTLTQEQHKEKMNMWDLLPITGFWGISADSVLALVVGLFVNIIFGFVIMLFGWVIVLVFKALPLRIAKAVFFSLAIMFTGLGIYVILL
jgi:hypothetical protein